MKNLLTFGLPVFLIVIVQTIARESGYILGALPTVLIALAAYAVGRKLGESWEANHKA